MTVENEAGIDSSNLTMKHSRYSGLYNVFKSYIFLNGDCVEEIISKIENLI